MGFDHAPYEYKYMWIGLPLAILGGLLCFLPFIARQTGASMVLLFALMPSIIFPLWFKIVVGALYGVLLIVGLYANLIRIITVSILLDRVCLESSRC